MSWGIGLAGPTQSSRWLEGKRHQEWGTWGSTHILYSATLYSHPQSKEGALTTVAADDDGDPVSGALVAGRSLVAPAGPA